MIINKNVLFITGPMFSGKSTLLIDYINNSSVNKLIFNYKHDKRYNVDGHLSTHNKNCIRSHGIEDAYEINNFINNYKSLENKVINEIYIDEVQFIKNTFKWINEMKDKYNIIIAGLNYDIYKRYFNKDIELIIKSNDVTKKYLYSRCYQCNKKAIYTQLIKKNSNINLENNIFISGKDNYQPVCNLHYNQQV